MRQKELMPRDFPYIPSLKMKTQSVYCYEGFSRYNYQHEFKFHSQKCYSRLDKKILCLVYILLFSKLHLKKPDQAQRYIASMDHKALSRVHC